MKLIIFISNLKKGKYFGNRKYEYIIRVIEYQHRGLPHAHIVVRLENVPAYNSTIDSDNTAFFDFIDEHFHATIPILTENSSVQDRRIHDLVMEHMQHKCSHGENGCKESATALCRKGFDSKPLTDRSYLNEKKSPVYIRLLDKDKYTVPHNRSILFDWEGHANVEFSNTPT
jgi:hypothetical protein